MEQTNLNTVHLIRCEWTIDVHDMYGIHSRRVCQTVQIHHFTLSHDATFMSNLLKVLQTLKYTYYFMVSYIQDLFLMLDHCYEWLK